MLIEGLSPGSPQPRGQEEEGEQRCAQRPSRVTPRPRMAGDAWGSQALGADSPVAISVLPVTAALRRTRVDLWILIITILPGRVAITIAI